MILRIALIHILRKIRFPKSTNYFHDLVQEYGSLLHLFKQLLHLKGLKFTLVFPCLWNVHAHITLYYKKLHLLPKKKFFQFNQVPQNGNLHIQPV